MTGTPSWFVQATAPGTWTFQLRIGKTGAGDAFVTAAVVALTVLLIDR